MAAPHTREGFPRVLKRAWGYRTLSRVTLLDMLLRHAPSASHGPSLPPYTTLCTPWDDRTALLSLRNPFLENGT